MPNLYHSYLRLEASPHLMRKSSLLPNPELIEAQIECPPLNIWSCPTYTTATCDSRHHYFDMRKSSAPPRPSTQHRRQRVRVCTLPPATVWPSTTIAYWAFLATGCAANSRRAIAVATTPSKPSCRSLFLKVYLIVTSIYNSLS